jgi:hypothetical protein
MPAGWVMCLFDFAGFQHLLLPALSERAGEKICPLRHPPGTRWCPLSRLQRYRETQEHHLSFLFLPPYAPELNPKENIWEEMREKIFKNYALKSMEAVQKKMVEACLYIERNPKIVKSITSFPYIINSL